jgi:hypothetical protein
MEKFEISEYEIKELENVMNQALVINNIEIITKVVNLYEIFNFEEDKYKYTEQNQLDKELIDYFKIKYKIDLYQYVIDSLIVNKFKKNKCLKYITQQFRVPPIYINSLIQLINYHLSMNKKKRMDILIYHN